MGKVKVCTVHDVGEGGSKSFPVNDDFGKVLIVHQHGDWKALSPKCTHFGAPLSAGVVSAGRVVCPWHGMSFDVETGAVCDAVGADGLQCYSTEVVGEDVFVHIPDQSSDTSFVKGKKGEEDTVVIIGGGIAGRSAAETLRLYGFGGKIIVLCKETTLPYNRVASSKDFSTSHDKWLLRDQQYYSERKISFMLGVSATKVERGDPGKFVIETATGATLVATKVILAYGAGAKVPQWPGASAANVVTIRDMSDNAKIRHMLEEGGNKKKIVIVGGGFIGLECAAGLAKNDNVEKVTVVTRDAIPMSKVFGEMIGSIIRLLHDKAGVEFVTNNKKTSIVTDKEGNAVGLDTDKGKIDADVIVLSIGATLKTGSEPTFSRECTPSINDDGGINVDSQMRTSIANMYAVGDIACSPQPYLKEVGGEVESKRVEHYGFAATMGKVASASIMKRADANMDTVPFFWTVQYGRSIRFIGTVYPGHAVPAKVFGEVDKMKAIAYFVHPKSKKICGVATIAKDPQAAAAAELLRRGRMPRIEEIREETDLRKYL